MFLPGLAVSQQSAHSAGGTAEGFQCIIQWTTHALYYKNGELTSTNVNLRIPYKRELGLEVLW